MENYDRDDAFFSVVERNNVTTNNYEQIRRAVADNIRGNEIKLADSMAANKKYEERVKKCERQMLIKRILVAAGIVSILASGITVTAVHGKDYVDTKSAITTMTTNANRVLGARRLSSYSMIEDNSISDYRNLNITDINEIYIYMFESAISRSTEEKKDFIKSVSYVNEEGKKCYYEDFNDFLIRNNFRDESEFKDFARKNILEKYRNGQIKELPFEGMSTVNGGGRLR